MHLVSADLTGNAVGAPVDDWPAVLLWLETATSAGLAEIDEQADYDREHWREPLRRKPST